MPDTTWAATREGSSTTLGWPLMSAKPKADTIMIRQAPTQTSMWVRNPAAQSSRSRSRPTRLPIKAVSASQAMISTLLSIAPPHCRLARVRRRLLPSRPYGF